MTVGAGLVTGAGLLAALAMVAFALLKARGDDIEAEDLNVPPRDFFVVAAAVFGGIGAVVGLGIAVGILVFDLPTAAVGLDASPVRGAAVGAVAGLGLAGGHKLLIKGLKAAGLEFTELYEEMVPETVPALGWYGAGIGVQASAEEVIFRAALVGAPAALLSVSPWYFVVPAAVLFGFAHTGRGTGSVVSTAIVGVAFGGLFVTAGLVAAAVAHVVNNTVAVAYSGLIKSDDGEETPKRPVDGVGE